MALHPSLRSHAIGEAKYCYFNKSRQTVGGVSISVVSMGREECLPDYRVSAVDGPYFALEFIASGRGELRSDDGQRELTPGAIFSYAHRWAPSIRSDEAHPMTKYFVTYTIHEAEDADPLAILSPGSGLTLRYAPDLGTFHALFEAMMNEARRPAAASTMIAYRFLELIALKAEHCRDEGEQRDSAAARTYASACSCIEANFLELDGLADLSARLSLDATYLCKLFRRFGEETPHQSIIRHKLNHAAEMLLGGTLPVNRIAEAIGFQDPFYFSRLFRKRFGMSPSHFRGGARRGSSADDA